MTLSHCTLPFQLFQPLQACVRLLQMVAGRQRM